LLIESVVLPDMENKCGFWQNAPLEKRCPVIHSKMISALEDADVL